MADCTPTMDIECELQHSPIVNWMKAKEQQLQMQVNRINDSINKTVIWPVGEKGIKQRLDDIEASVEDANDRVDQQNTVISEIGDNITLLKGMSTRQDEKINSLQKNVIADETYFNFEDWVENVYIPQGSAPVNKYSQWDIYMNVNPDVAATNATYVCIRPVDSTAPLSANDWQQMYYSAPADVMAILGIDPIKVTHPYKHEWVISVDPNRLADMIWGLRTLDLSKVEVTLWEVYFEPVIKESATIQENLTVWNTTTTKELDAETAYITKACIRELTCDTIFSGTPTFGTINVNDVITNNYHQDWGVFVIDGAHVSITWGTVEIPAIEWDTQFVDNIYAPNINITNKTETTELHVHNDSHFDWHVVINWDFKFEDQRPWHEWEVICLDNVAYNSFMPSYWFFTFANCGLDFNANDTTSVVWLGSWWIALFNSRQAHRAAYLWRTWDIVWDQSNATPWVYKDDTSWAIIIEWGNPDFAWVYQISFQVTAWFSPDSNWWFDCYAHRGWVVIYDADNISWSVYDDKHATWKHQREYTHNHTYRDWNNWDYASWWDWTFNTSSNTMSSLKYWWATNVWYSNVHYISDDHYTYTVSVTLPITKKSVLAPFMKFSSWQEWVTVKWHFELTPWEWVSWWIPTLSVVKIANVWQVYNYHC